MSWLSVRPNARNLQGNVKIESSMTAEDDSCEFIGHLNYFHIVFPREFSLTTNSKKKLSVMISGPYLDTIDYTKPETPNIFQGIDPVHIPLSLNQVFPAYHVF